MNWETGRTTHINLENWDRGVRVFYVGSIGWTYSLLPPTNPHMSEEDRKRNRKVHGRHVNLAQKMTHSTLTPKRATPHVEFGIRVI